jgi:GMP synthase (glutamine-hydrolysing)
VKKNYLFSSTFTAYELHNYKINPSNTFEILARSKKCIQGIKHKEKEIYGLLFHPEVRNKDIIRRFVFE